MIPREELSNRLEKAEKFFHKENFLLAKREFEFVYGKEPRDGIHEKIIDCTEKIARQESKSAVYRGKKHMKAGKLSKALACFEKAYAIQQEADLLEQITAIKKKLHKGTYLEELAQAEKKGVGECLAVCNAYLEKVADDEITKKKGICLVKLGQFDAAVRVFSGLGELDNVGKYYSGFAHAKAGQYVSALNLWFSISGANSEMVREQAKKLFPLVFNELHGTPELTTNSHQVLRKICFEMPKEKTLDPIRLLYIRWLWTNEKYLDIAHFLHPPPKELPPSLVNLFAKVYYKLACSSIEFLEKASTFWLTAVYNIEDECLRNVLLDQLQAVYHKHERLSSSKIPAQIRYSWKKERCIVEKLYKLGLRNTSDKICLCTPSFASIFGLSNRVAIFLKQKWDNHEISKLEYYETAAYFSPAAASVMLSGAGEIAQALVLLPRSGEDDVATFCRQNISFQYAIQNINELPARAVKALKRAIPLINEYEQFRKKLINFIYSEEGENAAPILADVMQKIYLSNKNQRFSEATAHCLCLKAMELKETVSDNYTAIEKILQRALTIDPNCQLAKTGLTFSKDHNHIAQIHKAFDKLKLAKAVSIVKLSNSRFVEEAFFDGIGDLYGEIYSDSTINHDEKLVLLNHIYTQCCQLDPEHPLVHEIRSAIGEHAVT